MARYMGIDLPNHRIVHVGSSRQNPIWLWHVPHQPGKDRQSNLV